MGLIVALGMLSALASADGGGGGHSGSHGSQAGHTSGHSSGGRGHSVDTAHRGFSLSSSLSPSGQHNLHNAGVLDGDHGVRLVHGSVRPDHHDLHDGYRLHHRPVGHHSRAFFGVGFSSFYVPAYYRYRYSCDPYSFYYDRRYCDRYFQSFGPYDVYGTGLPAKVTNAPPAASLEQDASRTAVDDELDSERIPDGVGARIALISVAEPPDVVP